MSSHCLQWEWVRRLDSAAGGDSQMSFFLSLVSCILNIMYNTFSHELEKGMYFSAYVDSVNYQLVILALVSMCVSPNSISLCLRCSHPQSVLAQ